MCFDFFKKCFLIYGLLTLALLICFCRQPAFAQSPAAGQQSAGRPNIIVIMADDLDSRQLSCYGGQNLKTTHIDRLAKEGLKFDNLIASEAMCVPTRASLFTGLYPARHGAYQNHKPVHAGLKSIAHYLGDLGYRVALTGKDHMTKPRRTFPFTIVPGFETNCVAETDDYFLDSVAQFMQQEEPFCLFVMSCNPHAPWTVGNADAFDPATLKLPAHWVDTEATRRQFARYLAEVQRLDDQVGDILALLESKNQLDNTLVIFLGEQGPQFPGGKWTLYDNGQRSSMIIRWPKAIPPGRHTDALLQYEDITPTLIDIAGGTPDKDLDGRSFRALIDGKQRQHRKFAFGMHNNIPEGPAFPMRSIRDKRYKLIWNLQAEEDYHIKYMTNTNNKGQVFSSWRQLATTDENARFLADRIVKHPRLEFYDLQEDPNELNNLAGQQKYKKRIGTMERALKKWMEQQQDSGAAMDKPF